MNRISPQKEKREKNKNPKITQLEYIFCVNVTPLVEQKYLRFRCSHPALTLSLVILRWAKRGRTMTIRK
jgi:hypothetical protein